MAYAKLIKQTVLQFGSVQNFGSI